MTRGDPYCGDCGYDLTGATDSSKCPECGRPLVEVLMRPVLEPKGSGRRYRSKARIGRLPVLDIAMGPSGDEHIGKARGFIAIGDDARGVLAIGGRSIGLVSIGGMAIGGFSLGGMSIGLFTAAGGMALGGMAAGGFAIGGLAQGGGAVGVMAQGGMAVGLYARGGGAFGRHLVSPRGTDPVADAAFTNFDWFFGAWPPNVSTMLGSIGSVFLMVVLAAIVIGVIAVAAIRREDGDRAMPT